MKPIILFREEKNETEEELKQAEEYFEVYTSRNDPRINNNLVIGRYSCLPYYKELVEDLEFKKSKLINAHRHHLYVSEFHYYYDVRKFTFETWFDNDFHKAPEGRYVVKGRTNSRKHRWKQQMYAPNKETAIKIACELSADSLISNQGIIYRKYEPLVTYDYGINGLPFTNEWRFFFLGNKLIDYGYYWSIHTGKIKEIEQEAIMFAYAVADIISRNVNFFVLDIAEKEDGGWVLVEVNDASSSGLSNIPEDRFYHNLSRVLIDSNFCKFSRFLKL